MSIHAIYRPFQQYFRSRRMRLFARLFDRKQMRTLIPDAEIIVERFLGMPKSLIAVRQ